MSDTRFTLFEVHLDEGSVQFGPSSIGAAAETEVESEPESAETTGHGCRCPGGKRGLLFLALFLLVVAVVVRRVFGGESLDELEALDELQR